MTWQEVLEHPSLQNLPFKIELNTKGIIEMTPVTNWHGFLQAEIAVLLSQLLPRGRCISEASIQTSDGVRVADVAWAERSFLLENRHNTPFQVAPAICVEIISPSNSKKEMQQKMYWYFEAGASEVWLCNLEGKVEFFNADGQLEQSLIAPEFPKLITLD